MSDFDYAPPEDGSPAPDAESQSTTTSVVVGGKTYRVPADMADAINAERNSYSYRAAPEPEEQVSGGVPDDGDFWEDPQSYIQKQIQKGIQDGIKGIQKKTAAQQAEQKFWTDFYSKNPHLKEIESYMTHLATQHVNQLKQFNGDTTKIANYIADLGNKELQKFGKTPTTSEVFVEGSAQPTPVVKTPSRQRDSNITTMGDVLRKRRESRRKARLGA